MKMIKVLLVDDHLIIRDGIKLLLKRNKEIKVVAEAENGEDAITYLTEKHSEIDVVLMDISMPEQDGIETTKIISKQFPNIKVLALTMHTEESYMLSMLESGALGYVLKDTGINELMMAIKSVHEGEKYFSKDASVTLINSFMNPTPKPTELTSREIKIVSHVSKGLTNKEIAKTLKLSCRTIETHRRNILSKLCVKNTAEMVRYALEKGILT